MAPPGFFFFLKGPADPHPAFLFVIGSGDVFEVKPRRFSRLGRFPVSNLFSYLFVAHFVACSDHYFI